MRYRLKHCVYIIVLMLGSYASAQSFNQVIEDFDTYLKSESSPEIDVREKLPKQKDIQKATDYQKIIQTLQAQLKKERNRADQATLDLKNLQDQFVESSDDHFLSRLMSKLEIPQDVSQLMVEAREFSNEKIVSLEQKLVTQQKKIELIQAELNKYQNEYDDVQKLLKVAEQNLQQKDAELAQMTKRFEQQKALQSSDYDQKLNKLMAQLDEKNAELVEQKALLDQTQAEKVFVEKNVEKLQLDLKSVMAQVTELENLKPKLQQKDAELAQMTKSFEQQKALQSLDYDQKLNKLIAQLDEKDAELTEQKALLDQTQAEKVFVEKNVEKLQLDLKLVMAQVTELENLKPKLQQKDAELAQMTKSLEQQKALQSSDYDQKLTEMKQLIQKSELEIANKISALEKSEQAKKSIEIQMIQLQKQLTAISLDKYQLKKLRKELENQKLELMNTKRQLKSHQKNYDQVQLLLSEANQQLDEVNHSLKTKDEALTKVATDKAALEDKLAQLELDIKKEHLKATGETNQTAQKFLTKAYQEIEELHKEMRTQSENYEKLYDEVKAKNEEVDSLRSQLEAVRWKNQKTQNLTKDLIDSKTQQKKCIMSETQEYQVGCI